MRKVTICGNGGLLDYILKKIKEDEKIEILGVVDRLEDIKAGCLDQNAEVVLGVAWREAPDWLAALWSAGVSAAYRVPMQVRSYGLEITSGGEFLPESADWITSTDVTQLYLETHVIDTCNLKCRGCMHFSNLAEKENIPNLESFRNDILRMWELFPHIIIIRLMGGEPFLNYNLAEYIGIVRNCYPACELRIVTNGLLIPSVSVQTWEQFRKYHVTVDISNYPPTEEHLERIRAVLEANGIPYGVGEPVREFRKSLLAKPSAVPERSMEICGSAHCRFLRNGRIAKCPLPLMLEDFTKAYGENDYPAEYYDIYEETDGRALKEKLDGVSRMCSWCPDKPVFIPWARTVNDAAKSDWIMEQENADD